MLKYFGVSNIVVSDFGVKEGYLALVTDGRWQGVETDLNEEPAAAEPPSPAGSGLGAAGREISIFAVGGPPYFRYFCNISDFTRIMKKTTLADNLPECSAAAAGFGDFFSGLLETTAAKTIDDALGQQIRAYVLGWLQTHPLTAFDDYSDTAYRRTYLGRCPATGWEAIVMSWKNGNRTSIHAHPQFAGYHIADGTFRLEIFEPAAGGAARLTESAVVEGPCAFFAVGAPGRFDNHIHRITCLSDTGHSLHVYSDDALRGEVYREE